MVLLRSFSFWFLALLLLAAAPAVQAQKFGYVDSQYILQKLPAYAAAQQEVNKMSAAWQKEIESKRKEIEKLQRDYQLSEPLLIDEQKKKRKDEIAKKEAEAKEFQQKTFGYEGTVFKKRQELMKPVQDQVFTAIEKVAKAKQLQIVFDKSGDLTMLYTNPTHDYTEYVLEELGIKSADKNDPSKPGSNKDRANLPGGGDGDGGKEAGNASPGGNDSPGGATPDDKEQAPAMSPGKKP